MSTDGKTTGEGDTPDSSPSTPVPAAESARLTVVESVHYQESVNVNPVSVESRYSRILSSQDVQPWSRRMKVGGGFVPLTQGSWVERPGMIVISNDRPSFATNPSPEDRAKAEGRVLLVAYDGADGQADIGWLIHPGESMRGWPTHPDKLMVRCLGDGETRFTVQVFPA